MSKRKKIEMICKVSDLSEYHHSMQTIQKRLQLNLLTWAVQGLPVDVLTHVVDFTYTPLPSTLLEDIKDYQRHLNETLALYTHFNRNREWGGWESNRYHMAPPHATSTQSCCAGKPVNSIAVLSPFAADLLVSDLLEAAPESPSLNSQDDDMVVIHRLVKRPGIFLRQHAQPHPISRINYTFKTGDIDFEYEMAKIEIRMLLAHMTPVERASFVAKVRERQELWPPSKLYRQM